MRPESDAMIRRLRPAVFVAVRGQLGLAPAPSVADRDVRAIQRVARPAIERRPADRRRR